MPVISYLEQPSLAVQTRVRARFARDIEALASLGFRELCYCSEQFGLFSSIITLPMSLLMLLKREVMTLDRGLRTSASFILMYHRDPAAVVVPLALGIKLYTAFTDRTLLISANFPSCAGSRPGSGVLKYSSKATIGEAWTAHQQRVRELEAQGKRIHPSVGFNEYVELSRLEETALN
jgi:hypothetical protein